MATKKACNALQTTFPMFAANELCTRLNLDHEIMSQIRPELQIRIFTEVTKNPQRFAHLGNEARVVACLDAIVDGIHHDIDLMKELIASLPKQAQMVLDTSVRFRSSGGNSGGYNVFEGGSLNLPEESRIHRSTGTQTGSLSEESESDYDIISRDEAALEEGNAGNWSKI
ncbi:hypothetical protein ABVK25_001714 [Lepraria finkii]|uniref:Uncharacterized protein n=1 Tax=Lepraria finkii TaxID=1340010 RepID=A0ABR4BMM9_9LECA